MGAARLKTPRGSEERDGAQLQRVAAGRARAADAPADAGADAVRLLDVTVDFSNTNSSEPNAVLDSLSLRVARGEFLAIVGASGCGKTTVLNVVIGFISPSRGEVTVLGTTPQAARPQMGYMLANDALLPWRTALRCVEFSLELKGVARKERRELAQSRLASLGLGDKGHLYPLQMSKGMRQRVALARTWVTEPELLLLDEPFGALDALTRAGVQAEFLGMWQETHASVIFVTHDLPEAVIMADRILVLGKGGEIRDEVTVPFPRPRDVVELSGLAEYGVLLKRLTNAL
ncbi:MAG: ABC transporter ATP-binding protein [Candidatus Dormibacteria bacterium]